MGSFSGYCCGPQHTELASPTWRATITFRAGRARRGPGGRESGRGLRAARAEPAPLFPRSGSRLRPSGNGRFRKSDAGPQAPFFASGPNLGARPPSAPDRRCISERQESLDTVL
jgi:hypothetical protein